MSETYAESIKKWQEMAAATDNNAAELPELEIQRQGLKDVLDEVLSLLTEQSIHRASKQQASKRLQGLIDRGTRLFNSMRKVIRHHYGPDSEKLVEFGMQPFRGRRRKEEVEPTPSPEDPGPLPEVESAKPAPSSDPAE